MSIKVRFEVPAACLLSLFAVSAFAQTDAIQTLQQSLLAPPATASLTVTELRLPKMAHSAETRVVNGVVQRRLLNLKFDTDEVLHAGDTVQIVKVEPGADKKNDFLRISLRGTNGGSTVVAFVLNKDALAGMDLSALEHLIGPIFATPTEDPRQAIATRAAVPPPPPPPPPHPAETVVDLPPAAEGLPALHASAPALEGCWWTPFYSPTFGLEMLVQKCLPGKGFGGTPVVFAEDKSGITAAATDSNGSLTAQDRFLTVLSKPSAQSLPAAVKQQFINKIPAPAARLSCVAKKDGPQNGTVESWSVSATGAYANLKRFNADDGPGEDPCPGAESDDVVGRAFYYLPSENKTKFIFFESEESWPYDPTSIHLAPPAADHAAVAGGKAQTSEKVAGTSSPKAESGNKFVPPVSGTWVNDSSLKRSAISPDAATMGSYNLGLIGARQLTTVLISCVGGKGEQPHVEINAILSVYPGYRSSDIGRGATLLVGHSRRDLQIESAPGDQAFYLTAALSSAEIAQLNTNDMLVSGGIGILFFAGGQRGVVSADLPESNDAMDTVMRACHVPTISHVHTTVASAVPAAEVKYLELAKVALGMTGDQVKNSLGAGFHYQSSQDAKVSSMSYLFALKADVGYTFTLIDGAVQGFEYIVAFQPGSQPLVTNLIDGVTAKTWPPLSGGRVAVNWWASDASGTPITKYTEPSHPRCRSVATSSNFLSNLPHVRSQLTGDIQLELIPPSDDGPDCGTTIQLSIQPSDRDPNLANLMKLLVGNQDALRRLLVSLNDQHQQDVDREHRKANQVINPF